MFYDHCIFVIKVRFTQTIYHRDSDGDVYETSRHPGTERTYHLVADKFSQGIAEAWVRDKFTIEKDANLEILAITQMPLDGCLINMMRL